MACAPHPPARWAGIPPGSHSGVLPTPQVGRDQLPLSHKPTASVREPLPSMTEATSMAVYAKCDVSKPKYPFCTHVFCQSLVILERLTGGRKTEAADTCVQLNCLLLATCASVLHPQQHTPLRISQAHRHPKRPRLTLFNSGAATTQKIMGAGNAVVQQHQVGNVESIRPVEHIMMKSTDRRRIFNTITLNVQGRWGE